MKKTLIMGLILAVVMILTPLAVQGTVEKEETVVFETLAKPKTEKTNGDDCFRIFNTETKEINTISALNYIFGVVASEMPSLYEEEALKAQAVASYTYACYKRIENKDKDYDLTDDFSLDQCYATEENLKEKWGDSFEEYSKKIKSVVNEVAGKIPTYNDEPILAVYHALSGGYTYSAKDVWGKDIEYLKGAVSESDTLEENYITVKEFSEKEIKKCFEYKKGEEVFGKSESNSKGLVINIAVYGKEISGNEVRSKLGLPSANFTVSEKQGKYVFTCKGYGHGVGMSQKGANSMAKQGFTYEEILLHYYNGVKLE